MAELNIRNVAVVGAGAVGAAIAAMMEDAGSANVSVVAEGERAARYRERGFLVNGKRYSFTVLSPDSGTAQDLIVVATKSYDLHEAIRYLDTFVGPHTIIMSLLNGISSEQTIAERFGASHVLPAMILGIDSVRENGEVRYANRGAIHLGPNPDATDQDEMVTATKIFLDRCEIPSVLSKDITRTLWWKFMINVGINQPSAILRATYGVFQRQIEARELMNAAMREVMTLSEKAHIGLTEQDLEDWQRTLATLDPDGKTSMLQDVEAGRRTEIELFAGTVVSLGEKYGVDVPVNRTFHNMLRIIETIAIGQMGDRTVS